MGVLGMEVPLNKYDSKLLQQKYVSMGRMSKIYKIIKLFF